MKRWVFIIFGVNLLARLLLINWHPATYTDSILYMNALERIQGTIILPAYPFAIVLLRKITGDPVIAGRLVSILAASLAIFPLFGLARIIYDRRSALFTILLYSVSPLIFRWSLRIFPHSLYSLFVLLFVYGIFKYIESDRVLFLAGGIFSGGVAVLTYPTGLVLVPVAVIAAAGYFGVKTVRENKLRLWLVVFPAGLTALAAAFFTSPPFQNHVQLYFAQVLVFFPVRLPVGSAAWQLAFSGGAWLIASLILIYPIPRRGEIRGWWYRRPLVPIVMTLAFSSYYFLYIWQIDLAQSTWYQQGMITSYGSLAGRWQAWLSHYLYSYPYVIVYPVALAALLGLIMTLVSLWHCARRVLWLSFYGYFLSAIFYALVVNKWWTPRYQYTLVPFALVLAGYGLSRLWGWNKIKWVGRAALFICLGTSLLFTAFVLYWSRESFADISRSALFLKDHFLDRRIFTDELQKTGFWAGRPLRGYTRQTRSTLKDGDILVLHGWHTNLATEYSYLNRFYQMEILQKFPVDIVPLLADDVVDWAGKRLRRRANAPVVWDERFRKQHIESWIIAVKSRRDGQLPEETATSGDRPPPGGALPGTEYADYFDIGLWEVTREVPRGQKVVLEMAHAAPGPGGAFRMIVYTDSNGDGLPDRQAAVSPLLEGEQAGAWSRWEFTAPGGPLFVGSSWRLGTWVFYSKSPWIDLPLGEVMYYSRGGMPHHKAHRSGRLKISFPVEESASATPSAPGDTLLEIQQ